MGLVMQKIKTGGGRWFYDTWAIISCGQLFLTMCSSQSYVFTLASTLNTITIMSTFKFPFCLLCLVFLACNNQQLVGKWKRELNPEQVDTSQNINSDWGNIVFREDSTFTITGYTITSVESSVSGWHTDGPVIGRWRVEENDLLLNTDDSSDRFYLRFRIVELTSSRLSIVIPPYLDDTSKAITYTRK